MALTELTINVYLKKALEYLMGYDYLEQLKERQKDDALVSLLRYFKVLRRGKEAASHIREMFRLLMGDDYRRQIAKRKLLCEDDDLIRTINAMERFLGVNIF